MNRHGWGVTIFVGEDIPSTLLSKRIFPNDTEGMFFEINLRKTKWIRLGTYHTSNQTDDYFFKSIGTAFRPPMSPNV